MNCRVFFLTLHVTKAGVIPTVRILRRVGRGWLSPWDQDKRDCHQSDKQAKVEAANDGVVDASMLAFRKIQLISQETTHLSPGDPCIPMPRFFPFRT
jgi:hypothetical protein